MSNNNEYTLKWVKDILAYHSFSNSFILEGSVNDFHPFKENETHIYIPCEEVIARHLSDKYCVVFFDHTKQAGSRIEDGEDEEEYDEDTGEAKPKATPFDPTHFNSFIFFDAENNQDNVEIFKTYYKDEFLKRIEGTVKTNIQTALNQDIFRMRSAIEEFDDKRKEHSNAKPFLFILLNVSRYMTSPGRPNNAENAALMVLFKTLQLTDHLCKIFLLTDKVNDLPSWFEAENSNPSLKKMFIPQPDKAYREVFFRNEMLPLFNPVDDEKLIEKSTVKFSGYTENFSTKKLLQLKLFIQTSENDEVRNILNIGKTILDFDFGYATDPWTSEDMVKKIQDLETINKEIVGQPKTVQHVQTTLKSAVVGLSNTKSSSRKPRAVFFFAGPTGTGKTEITKTIAERIFGKADAMIRFDMSEFREEISDSRLFGAPPGYVGYEAGGELTKAVKQNPFSIILFDEIEKANPKIWDKFLQILGDGRLTDAKGETVFFSETIIVFTSNLGITPINRSQNVSRAQIDESLKNLYDRQEEILKKEELTDEDINEIEHIQTVIFDLDGIHFKNSQDKLFSRETKIYERKGFPSPIDYFNNFVENKVRNNVISYFENISRREVFGRIGENNILVFNFINPVGAKAIAKNKINSFIKYLKEDHDSRLNLVVDDEAIEHIVKLASTPEILDLGGRGVVNTVEEVLRNIVSDYIFEHLNQKDLNATISVKDGELVIN